MGQAIERCREGATLSLPKPPRRNEARSKPSLLLSLILCSALASAQFPSPRDFQIQVRYITIDQSDWCGAYYVAGPNYCNLGQGLAMTEGKAEVWLGTIGKAGGDARDKAQRDRDERQETLPDENG